MKKIPLTRGYVALVDDHDFEHLSRYKWYVLKVRNTQYAVRNKAKHEPKPTTRCMHRDIMEPQKGLDVDHMNGDGLDNRRRNLRVVTRAENNKNLGIDRRNTSGVRGVGWCAQRKKWHARIGVGGRLVNLGFYRSLHTAAGVRRGAEVTHGFFQRDRGNEHE